MLYRQDEGTSRVFNEVFSRLCFKNNGTEGIMRGYF